MVRLGTRWLSAHGCILAASEIGSGPDEPDCIGFTAAGHCVYIECKTSRADFLRDRLKWHRRQAVQGTRDGLGNRRYYLAPEAAIRDGDELNGWGILRPSGSGVARVRESQVFTSRPQEMAAGDGEADARHHLRP